MSSRKRLTKYHGQSDVQVRPADNLPRPTVAKRPPAKKNTKLWCKGKVGREHSPKIQMSRYAGARSCMVPSGWRLQMYPRSRWLCFHEIVCTGCDKIINHFLDPDQCPDRPAS